MITSRWWKYFKNSPEGIALTVTLAGTGAATAKLLPNGKIIVDAVAAQHTNTITLTTPVSFKVVDAKFVNGGALACALTIKNGSGAITDALTPAAGADKVVARAGTVDDTYTAFTKGDDDLVLSPATANLTGQVIIEIQFT